MPVILRFAVRQHFEKYDPWKPSVKVGGGAGGIDMKDFTVRVDDARKLDWIDDESVHLVVTSPPYWTLKKYNDHCNQLGAIANYEEFLDALDEVWRHCYRVLV